MSGVDQTKAHSLSARHDRHVAEIHQRKLALFVHFRNGGATDRHQLAKLGDTPAEAIITLSGRCWFRHEIIFSVEATGIPKDYEEHVRLMCDMLVLAFQTDQTRIVTLPFANGATPLVFSPAGTEPLGPVSPAAALLPNTTVVESEACFAAVGWYWGGRWTASPDYQHFSATGG